MNFLKIIKIVSQNKTFSGCRTDLTSSKIQLLPRNPRSGTAAVSVAATACWWCRETVDEKRAEGDCWRILRTRLSQTCPPPRKRVRETLNTKYTDVLIFLAPISSYGGRHILQSNFEKFLFCFSFLSQLFCPLGVHGQTSAGSRYFLEVALIIGRERLSVCQSVFASPEDTQQ